MIDSSRIYIRLEFPSVTRQAHMSTLEFIKII